MKKTWKFWSEWVPTCVFCQEAVPLLSSPPVRGFPLCRVNCVSFPLGSGFDIVSSQIDSRGNQYQDWPPHRKQQLGGDPDNREESQLWGSPGPHPGHPEGAGGCVKWLPLYSVQSHLEICFEISYHISFTLNLKIDLVALACLVLCLPSPPSRLI